MEIRRLRLRPIFAQPPNKYSLVGQNFDPLTADGWPIERIVAMLADCVSPAETAALVLKSRRLHSLKRHRDNVPRSPNFLKLLGS